MVFDFFEEDFDFVTELRRLFAELVNDDNAFRFVADVNDHIVVDQADDAALENGLLLEVLDRILVL